MPFFPSEKAVHFKSIEYRYFDPDRASIELPSDAEITILRGGSSGQRGRLLSAACREAINRDLPVVLWQSHNRIHPIAAILGERICLLTEPIDALPLLREEVSLSPLIDRDALSHRKAELSELAGKIARLQDHYGMLRSADLSLASLAHTAVEPCLLSEKLSAFCGRLFDKLRLPTHPTKSPCDFGKSQVRVCVSAPGREIPADPGVKAAVRIGVSDRVGIGGLLLDRISAEAERRGIEQRIYTDFADVAVGIYFPAGRLYIGKLADGGSAVEKDGKAINCGRFVSKEGSRQIRPMLRSIYAQRQEIGRLMDDRRKKIADLMGKIDEIYDSAVKSGDFADFEKDLLISLFCR